MMAIKSLEYRPSSYPLFDRNWKCFTIESAKQHVNTEAFAPRYRPIQGPVRDAAWLKRAPTRSFALCDWRISMRNTIYNLGTLIS